MDFCPRRLKAGRRGFCTLSPSRPSRHGFRIFASLVRNDEIGRELATTTALCDYRNHPVASSCMDGPSLARVFSAHLAFGMKRSCIRPLLCGAWAAGQDVDRRPGSHHSGALSRAMTNRSFRAFLSSLPPSLPQGSLQACVFCVSGLQFMLLRICIDALAGSARLL